MVTIDDPLKLTAVLDIALVQFRRTMLPINLLGAVFSDIPRRGKNTITVPKFVRSAQASGTRAAGESYFTKAGTYEIGSAELAVNQNKIQGLTFTNEQLVNEPMLDDSGLELLGRTIGEKLAHDVLQDILSVFTLANFDGGVQGNAGVIAPEDLDQAEFRNFRKLANKEFWPQFGRVAILNSDYDCELGKSQRVLDHGNHNDPRIFLEGMVNRVAGFDIVECTVLPDNDEFLGGILVAPGAMGIGFAPVEPTAAIRGQLHDYQIVKDEFTGIVLEYVHCASGHERKEGQFIECHYGFEVFMPENAKLIHTAD